ncbi:MAG TPA: hypothetical protein VNY05_38890 [Candidatus Acidoferrales bacterium]|jgi:hypothetical protein|nr:hypothetical protein [Candidatus Acidoferrales bacterium]
MSLTRPKYFGGILRPKGYVVLETPDAETAVGLGCIEDINLLIADVMPPCSGIHRDILPAVYMLCCPECGARVNLGNVAPETTDMAARGVGFARWRQSDCPQCKARLEIVPRTKWVAFALSLVLVAAPVLLLAGGAAVFPESFLGKLSRMQVPPVALKLLILVWVTISFRLVFPRVVRLRVGYDPEQPLSLR